MTKADPVQSHLSAFPAAQRRALESTRSALIRLLPGADEVIAWGMDSRAALKAVEAPNAMPPEQAFLALNAARAADWVTAGFPRPG